METLEEFQTRALSEVCLPELKNPLTVLFGHFDVAAPVWWFLQGLEGGARNHLEVRGFRVIDFTRDPIRAEVLQAFTVPDSLRTP